VTSIDGADEAPSELVGAIDIGTNSVLLLIAAREPGRLVARLERATLTRLGEGVDRTRRLDPEAVRRTLACLADYGSELRRRGVRRVAAVGTSAMRDAEGGHEFLDEAERLLGARPQVVSGQLEAELTFEGALGGLDVEGPVMVFDVGGGSTEVILGHARPGERARIERALSLEIGSVRLYERHVRQDPPATEELLRVAADVERALTLAPRPEGDVTLVGVAGTVTTLAALELGLVNYESARVHGYRLSRTGVFALAAKLAKLDLAARKALTGLDVKRADVIPIGAEIVRRVMVFAAQDTLVTSDRGVRWGVAERLLECGAIYRG
jgi:exopolyphosphatase/guanosine-5'-triphosphate,3'-diphosphate pyrophosphatase